MIGALIGIGMGIAGVAAAYWMGREVGQLIAYCEMQADAEEQLDLARAALTEVQYHATRADAVTLAAIRTLHPSGTMEDDAMLASTIEYYKYVGPFTEVATRFQDGDDA